MSATPPDARAEARRWLGEADEELLVATVLSDSERVPARAACFHAHLAAEKTIKALLVLRGVLLPRSHDLIRLAQLLPSGDRARFDLEDLAELNPWTIEGRYPADLGDIGSAGVGDLLDRARRIVESVRPIFN